MWTRSLTALGLDFHIYKMGLIVLGWQDGCKDQMSRYLQSGPSVDENMHFYQFCVAESFFIFGNSGPVGMDPRPSVTFCYPRVLKPSCTDPGYLKEPQTNLSLTLPDTLIRNLLFCNGPHSRPMFSQHLLLERKELPPVCFPPPPAPTRSGGHRVMFLPTPNPGLVPSVL